MSTTTVTITETDLDKLKDFGKRLKEGLEAGTDVDPDSVEARTFEFAAMDLTSFTGKCGSGGRDCLQITFKGRGSQAFRVQFASGESVDKGQKTWSIEQLRFDPLGFAMAGPASHGDDAGADEPATIDNPPEDDRHHDDLDVEVLDLADKHLRAKISTGGVAGPNKDPDLTITIEMGVMHGCEGLVRDATGSDDTDKHLLTPETLETVGRLCCRQGTLTLVRAVEAKQQTLGLETPAASAAEVKEPQPPEGVKEKTLRRGTRPAREAFERAVSATTRDGQVADLAAIRAEYDSDQACYLRTWKGGPVKVCKEFRTVYLLTMAADGKDGESADGNESGTAEPTDDSGTEGD